ncbi:MAG: ABC transporter ATP-binding protein [Arthrobacter sp.]|jgi:iron complex transport system ATP-binding protein|nr:ABC transporter ATP-binding protein [Arthrobacter sp.]
MTTPAPQDARLCARDLSVGYKEATVVKGLDLDLPVGRFTVIVGPNACGKSTLLRALARLLPARSGAALLDGREVHRYRSKDFARRLTLLPQAVPVPEGITVADLVARGRFPHQGMLRQWSPQDEAAVREALAVTGVSALADRPVDDLSGGQRQRVLISMALAQDTELLLLDEPTTYLDITHQIEVLELCSELVQRGRTVVAVLHDLQLAARYADHLVALRAGELVAQGGPAEVVTPELIEATFGLRARVLEDPETGAPLVVPLAGRAALPGGAVPGAAGSGTAAQGAAVPPGDAALVGSEA